jgi:hypothetical protein
MAAVVSGRLRRLKGGSDVLNGSGQSGDNGCDEKRD